MKLVIIGGGSVLWGPRLSCDLFLEPSLEGSDLYLVDPDYSAVTLVAEYLRQAIRQNHLRWKIHITGLIPALKNADLVLISISTGGLEAMMNDYCIPEKYGIYHTVGDTVGPGGISRALRNIPVFIDFAQKMNKYCSNAYLLHVTNPLSQLTRAVEKSGYIRTAGFCHEYTGMTTLLKDFFGVEEHEIDGLCLGVNHFTILKNLTVRNHPNPSEQLTIENYIKYEQSHNHDLQSCTVDDLIMQATDFPNKNLYHYINFYLKEKWGFFPMVSSCHICENLPGFNQSPGKFGQFNLYRKGVLPNRAVAQKNRRDNLEKILKEKAPIPEMKKRSREMFADAAVALLTGEPRRVIAAQANNGQISNLPLNATVETWNLATRSGIHPIQSGSVCTAAKGFLEQIITEEELTVEAAMTGSFDILVNAMTSSPMVHDKSLVPQMARELVRANSSWLPQFHPCSALS